MERGRNPGFPFSSQVKASRFPEMRELRAQAGGDPLRMLYAFDSLRTAILLVAGDKRATTAGMRRTCLLPTGCLNSI